MAPREGLKSLQTYVWGRAAHRASCFALEPCSAKNGDWESAQEAEPRRGRMAPMEPLCGTQAVGADDGNRRRALEFDGKQRAEEQVISE